MGNFEKLVVLIVLFLAAVVLAVSLRDGDPAAESPLHAAQSRLQEDQEDGGAPATKAPIAAKTPTTIRAKSPGKTEGEADGRDLPSVAATDPASGADREADRENQRAPSPGYLLDAGDAARGKPVEPVHTGAAIEAAVAPAGASALDAGPVRILRTTHGLEPSALEDFMVYTIEAGDTWASLAQRFYRDRGLSEVLTRANEGVRDLVAGTSILVPVYDLAREAEQREPWTSVAAAGSEGAGEPAPAIEPGSHLGDTSYVVVGGDTLSGISLKVYGTAQRWKEIFEANRQRMASPDWLQVGMRLSIPQGAELDELRQGLRKDAQGRPRVR